MPEPNPQSSDTGNAPSGIQIPKERFDEVAAQVKEARARADAAERKFQESEKARQADQARLTAIERRFAPDPEPDYVDPAEKALSEVAELRKRMAERDESERIQKQYRDDGAAISAAIETAGIADKKKASEALAMQYGAARHFGNAWDPAAAAKVFREEEKEAAELRARAARDNADATRSAITGSGSAPAVATTPPPKRPEPGEEDFRGKLGAWEAEMERRIIAEARAGR